MVLNAHGQHDGHTPLTLAVSRGEVAAVKVLLGTRGIMVSDAWHAYL